MAHQGRHTIYRNPMKIGKKDEWMDDLRFYVLFNSVSIISVPLEVENERQQSSIYGWEDFALSGDQTRSGRSVGQRLTH